MLFLSTAITVMLQSSYLLLELDMIWYWLNPVLYAMDRNKVSAAIIVIRRIRYTGIKDISFRNNTVIEESIQGETKVD